MRKLTDKEFIKDLYESLDRFTCGECFLEAVAMAIWTYDDDDDLRNLVAIGWQPPCEGPEYHYPEEDDE
jgi:hypothetical protein